MPGGTLWHCCSRHGTWPPAPLLPEVAEAVRVAAPSGRVYIASDGWEMEPLLRRWAADEAPEWPLSFTAPSEAEAILVVFDDTLPELYSVWPEVRASLAEADRWALRVGDVPLFWVLSFPR